MNNLFKMANSASVDAISITEVRVVIINCVGVLRFTAFNRKNGSSM